MPAKLVKIGRLDYDNERQKHEVLCRWRAGAARPPVLRSARFRRTALSATHGPRVLLCRCAIPYGQDQFDGAHGGSDAGSVQLGQKTAMVFNNGALRGEIKLQPVEEIWGGLLPSFGLTWEF